MELKKFEDIVSLQRGYDFPEKDRIIGTFPLVSSNGIFHFVKESKCKGPGVVTGRSGTIGNVFYVEDDYWPLNTTLFVKDFHNNNPKYISYWLSTFPLAKYANGASVPTLNRNELTGIICKIHNIKEQQHIVNTIGSVDDLIESNANFISKFQQYLSQIYKLYCLDINYEVELNSLIVRTGKTLKNKEWFGSNVLDLSTMPNNNIFINDFSCGENFTTNIKTLNNLDLVYGSIRPYFKKAGFALDVDYIAGSVYSFMPLDEKNYLWLLACICSDDFHLFTSSNSQGTKMPIINWDTFSSFKIRYDSKIIHEFNKQVQPLFDLCVIKAREIRRLKAIKEKLLSKYF